MYNKLIIPVLLAVTLFSCSKIEAGADHSCCNKGHTTTKVANSTAAAHSENNSLYQLTGNWTNQQNENIKLDQLKGKVRLVAMIFTHCGYACPKMVENIKEVENALPDGLKDKVGYVLVTFDPERDTPERLKYYAEQKHLDSQWTLLRGEKNQVRLLSMLLQLQYNQIPGGDFNHSNILTVLDDNGAIVKQFKGLDIQTEKVLEVVKQVAG